MHMDIREYKEKYNRVKEMRKNLTNYLQFSAKKIILRK